ncbi:MAG: bifunctional 3-deoxy-7-phosphoheptulonate synthase/chorismate mutase [Gemmatimonadota bacterium]|nr:MAG: bifunctional 3-deoxy-7-phosphoheptulonate synthase/chorismate mutase [Gemmatimonadota bacterium]
MSPLRDLRDRIDEVNEQILDLLSARGEIVLEIARDKGVRGLDGYDPSREERMLAELTSDLRGPFAAAQIRDVFRTIFRISLELQDVEHQAGLHVRRRDLVPEGGILVGAVPVGGPEPVLFAGPCSVETPEQMDAVGAYLAAMPGLVVLRAGAFKPRTNPASFQGLREKGLRILKDTADRHGLATVTEVLDVATLPIVAEHTDMLQIGARNMYNTELLKAVSRLDKPVLLKRGFMATIQEWLLSAEYILSGGNESVVLCERGIRTFEPSTRNTFDVAAIPLMKGETSLPVIADVSHALGRKDLLLPCSRAALAAGADGLMIETHPTPDQALSDGFQQLDLSDFGELVQQLGWSVGDAGTGGRFPAEPLVRAGRKLS